MTLITTAKVPSDVVCGKYVVNIDISHIISSIQTKKFIYANKISWLE